MSDYSNPEDFGSLPLWAPPRPLGTPLENILPDPTKFGTLKEAQEDLKANMSTTQGGSCPACGRYAKIWKRKLNSAMARALLLLYNKKTDEYTHYRDDRIADTLPSRDFGTLVHWGLTEAKKGKSGDGNGHTGYYRITPKGREFVMGRLTVQRHVYLYNNEMVDVEDEETTTIREALGEKFNYDELMGS